MNLHAIHFGPNPLFKRFHKVLEYSALKNSPNTPLTIHSIIDLDKNITSRMRYGCNGHDTNNSLKTKHHNEIVQDTPNGELIGLIDLDTVIVGDLSPIISEDFDLAVTVREAPSRVNSGVVFVRVSETTKIWYDKWFINVWTLLRDTKLRKELKQKYAGINQSSLAMLMNEPHDLKIKEFHCKVWNCIAPYYQDINEETKIIHLMDKFKQAMGSNLVKKDRHLSKVIQIWRELEREVDNGP